MNREIKIANRVIAGLSGWEEAERLLLEMGRLLVRGQNEEHRVLSVIGLLQKLDIVLIDVPINDLLRALPSEYISEFKTRVQDITRLKKEYAFGNPIFTEQKLEMRIGNILEKCADDITHLYKALAHQKYRIEHGLVL